MRWIAAEYHNSRPAVRSSTDRPEEALAFANSPGRQLPRVRFVLSVPIPAQKALPSTWTPDERPSTPPSEPTRHRRPLFAGLSERVRARPVAGPAPVSIPPSTLLRLLVHCRT